MPCSRRTWFVAALALAASACGAEPLSARYRILDQQPDGSPLSRRVLLVADNQIHHLYGEPYWIRSELTDKVVSVAIRPVQLDLFGQDLLRWTVEERGADTPIIHLGDALDLGCAVEFESFQRIMARARQPWVLAPGNHDGYFAGNLGANQDWPGACKNGGGPVDKGRFVELYLRALAGEPTDAGCKALRAEALSGELPLHGEWRYQGSERAFLLRAAWSIDRASPWRSYVVQEVDLSSRNAARPSRAYLLDTSQYDISPSFPLTAGTRGEILADQQEVIRRWVSEPRGELITVMGHHPFGDLSRGGRALIDDLRWSHGAILYVSAHTHAGRYFVRGSGADTWLELNVGSIVDWPPEVRTLQFISSRKDGRVAALTPLVRVADELSSSGVPLHCDPAWEARPTDEDYYLSYRQRASLFPGPSQGRLAETMLAAYRRLFTAAPTKSSASWPAGCRTDAEVIAAIDRARDASVGYDARVALLVELSRFEAERVAVDEGARASFRLCQAIWASKYEQSGDRVPVVEDWAFDFPKE